MVVLRTVVVSFITVLSILVGLQPGIRCQSTVGFSPGSDSCSKMEEDWELQLEEIMHLKYALEIDRQKIKTLENACRVQMEANHRLNLVLAEKQEIIETLENATSAKTEENERLDLELEKQRQLIEALENTSSSQSEENRRLKLEIERLQKRTKPVTATFIGSFDHLQNHYGITKVENTIYVLKSFPNRIEVYKNAIDFPFMDNITLSGSSGVFDIVFGNESQCLYISDHDQKCIWALTTTREHRKTKWLTGVTDPYTLGLSNEGHLLVLRQNQSFRQDSLEIYSLNATLIRGLQLPQDVRNSQHVVQTSNGNFIILHQLSSSTANWTSGQMWVISQLANDGQLIHRFIPRKQAEDLGEPRHMSLDSENNRLFVGDRQNHRVMLFDSSVLTWIQVLLSKEMNGIHYPGRLFYDSSKEHLFVAQHFANVTVFEIN